MAIFTMYTVHVNRNGFDITGPTKGYDFPSELSPNVAWGKEEFGFDSYRGDRRHLFNDPLFDAERHKERTIGVYGDGSHWNPDKVFLYAREEDLEAAKAHMLDVVKATWASKLDHLRYAANQAEAALQAIQLLDQESQEDTPDE